MVKQFIYIAVYFLIFQGCNSNHNQTVSEPETSIKDSVKLSSYQFEIIRKRLNKNNNLIKNGVIEQDSLIHFKGLKYFEVDSTYIVKAKVEKLMPTQVSFGTTSNEMRTYFKFLKLSFNLNGTENILFAYIENPQNPTDLFIPFKDLSNNNTTYGAGRYMDLKYKGEETFILLDFNYAYNPYCHYNHHYSCPMVPIENHLKTEINAGEKKLYN